MPATHPSVSDPVHQVRLRKEHTRRGDDARASKWVNNNEVVGRLHKTRHRRLGELPEVRRAAGVLSVLPASSRALPGMSKLFDKVKGVAGSDVEKSVIEATLHTAREPPPEKYVRRTLLPGFQCFVSNLTSRCGIVEP